MDSLSSSPLNKDKKILIFCNSYWNIRNFRIGLVKDLINNGYSVSLLAAYDKYYDELKGDGYDCNLIDLSRSGTAFLNELVTLYNTKKLLKKINPDLILSFTIKPNIYSAITSKSRLITNITGLGSSFLKNNIKTFFIKCLYRFSCRLADKVVFQNQDDRFYFINNHLCDNNKTILIRGSGIDTNYYSSQIVNHSYNPFHELFPKKSKIILYVGRLIKDKGILEYLNAANKFISDSPNSNIVFGCIGDLDQENPSSISQTELESLLIAGKIEHINFVEDIRNYLKFSCFVCLPSYREGLSKALLESMSMSKPIITSDAPGCIDLITKEINGYVVKIKSVGSLVKIFKKIENLSQKEIDLMGRRSREATLEKYSLEAINLSYLQSIRDCFNDI